MARKTAILVALKYEQKSTELAKAVAIEERVDQGIEIPAEEAQILDVEAVAEPQKSALDKLAEKAAPPPMAPPAEYLKGMQNAPPCAGCGSQTPICTASDAEGRAFHQECLDVLKKAAKK
jgi:hypothetical protein